MSEEKVFAVIMFSILAAIFGFAGYIGVRDKIAFSIVACRYFFKHRWINESGAVLNATQVVNAVRDGTADIVCTVCGRVEARKSERLLREQRALALRDQAVAKLKHDIAVILGKEPEGESGQLSLPKPKEEEK